MKKNWANWLWNTWCVASIIGIWPRFIEPKLLKVNRYSLPISHWPKELIGLKILQFSDLHWHTHFSPFFLRKLTHSINMLEPDLIVFTGDFLNRSCLENPEGLQHFLCSLKAKVGCFAILGNHDYEQFVTINPDGDYDVEVPSSKSDISKGFRRLFHSIPLSDQVTSKAKSVGLHIDLIQLLEKTPFQLLKNQTQQINYKNSWLNVSGLEEYTLARFNPEKTFQDYNSQYPGIVLSHHPDTIPLLMNYPGDLILAGHTHGGQVNLPFIWKKFTSIKHLEFKKGLKHLKEKWIYTNRGVGSVVPFRWFSIPELTLFTLNRG